jgi:hypothetical protein
MTPHGRAIKHSRKYIHRPLDAIFNFGIFFRHGDCRPSCSSFATGRSRPTRHHVRGCGVRRLCRCRADCCMGARGERIGARVSRSQAIKARTAGRTARCGSGEACCAAQRAGTGGIPEILPAGRPIDPRCMVKEGEEGVPTSGAAFVASFSGEGDDNARRRWARVLHGPTSSGSQRRRGASKLPVLCRTCSLEASRPDRSTRPPGLLHSAAFGV